MTAIAVPEGTPEATLMAVKRVNELDFYSMNHTQLAANIDITMPQLTAYICLFGLKDDERCSKEFAIGKMRLRRYSPLAIERVREAMVDETPHDTWRRYRSELKKAAGG